MRFGVLGPLGLEGDDGTDLLPGSPNQRTVLACLLADTGAAIRSDALIDAVWGDAPPQSAETTLRTYVSRLRSILGERLVREGGSYRLRLAADDRFDAARFETLIADGGADSLRAALDLWRGDAFCDFADVEPVVAQARRLDELRVSTVDRYLAARLDEERTDPDALAGTVADAEAHLTAHPLRERSWAVLVQALHHAGRSADALRAFQRAVDALADAGLEPSAELRAAEQVALGITPTEPSPPVAAAPTTAVPSTAIPSTAAPTTATPADETVATGEAGPRRRGDRSPVEPPTPLVGREHDLGQIESLLATAPLVTLHGPGGVGKTRLSTAIAARWSDRLGSPARVAKLARLTGEGSVGPAVLAALDVPVDDGSVAAALGRAAGIDGLLVIDNCEHVIDEVAETVELLTAPASQLTVLCTSRERLGVAGEHSWSLAPLPADGPTSPAVELFVQRLGAHRAGASVGPEERIVAQRIARRLDGLPLAIEMAAARAGSIGLSQLESALGDRLDILRSANRRIDPRHRTLRAVIEWSEELLDDTERRVFRDLAVFAGPVSADDIEAVLDRPSTTDAPSLNVLSDLVDRSLVVADVDGPSTTFRLLQTVRQHISGAGAPAPESNGANDGDGLIERHRDHYIELARAADAELRGETEPEALATLERAMAEFRAVHQRHRTAAPTAAVALSAALYSYAVSRNADEVQTWAEELVDDHGPTGSDGVVVLTGAAYRANNQGRYDDARRLAGRAVELAGGDPSDRFAHEVLGDTALYNGDIEGALTHGWALLAQSERVGDAYGVSAGYCGLALPFAYSGRRDEALALVEGVDTTGWGPTARGWMRYTVGEILLDTDPDPALEHLRAATELADGVDARFLSGVSRVSTSSLLSRHGRPDLALRSFAEIVDHWRIHRHSTHQVTTLRNLTVLFDRLGDHEAATRLLGVIEAGSGPRSFGDEAVMLDQVRESARRALGQRFDELTATGAALDLDRGIEAALADIDRLLADGV